MNEPELGGHTVRNPEVTYESRDLSARAVVGFLISLAIAGVLVQVVLWGIYKYLAGPVKEPTPITNPMMTSNKQLQDVGGDPAVKFPSPRLQPDPVGDLNKFRQREEDILNSYGWVDQANGKVHVPIEQAIQMVAKTGLPVRPEGGMQAGQKPSTPPGATGAAGGINVKQGAGKLPPVQQ